MCKILELLQVSEVVSSVSCVALLVLSLFESLQKLTYLMAFVLQPMGQLALLAQTSKRLSLDAVSPIHKSTQKKCQSSPIQGKSYLEAKG